MTSAAAKQPPEVGWISGSERAESQEKFEETCTDRKEQ